MIAMASLLFQTRYPTGFPTPEINSGGAGGVRVGYQVNSVAGFDAILRALEPLHARRPIRPAATR